MVNLEWYRSFLEVYRVGTVSGAARALALTQPAVSQHLAALESAASGALFTRTPRRMLPTEKGKELYTQVVQSLERLESVSFNLGRDPGRDRQAELPLLRLGAPTEFLYEVLLGKLGSKTSRVRVSFSSTPKLIDGLVSGKLDLVVATQKIAAVEVEYSPLGEERFVLISAKDAKPPQELEPWLLKQPWVAYGVELPIIRRYWLEVFKKRPEIRPALVLPNLHCILKAVELGQGLSVVPDYIARESLRAGTIKILSSKSAPVVKNDLWLAWRKSERSYPIIQEWVRRLGV